MEAAAILEDSFTLINRNFDFYRDNYRHQYYVTVDAAETSFIDKHFKEIPFEMKPQDKMLNFSISTICTATAILLEVLDRSGIKYDESDLEAVCKGYTSLDYEKYDLSGKSFETLQEDLFALLTDGIDLGSRKKSGSERTPNEIIGYMLDLIGYKGNIILNKKITDPACGTGTFVAQIISRFIDAFNSSGELSIVKKLVEDKCITAYDTKPSNVFITKVIITSWLVHRNLLSSMDDIVMLMSELPVFCNDYLVINEKTDYIVGNPPYIRLQNLSNENRSFIKDNFRSATGRFDIYTCFLENGDRNLAPGGKMCLITSNKYLTANYGVGIRTYLSESGHVKKIVDLFDTKFFGAAVLPAITLCESSKKSEEKAQYIGIKTSQGKPGKGCKNAKDLFEYIEEKMDSNKSCIRFGKSGDRIFEISKSSVQIPLGGKTWNFSSGDENNIKDIMDGKAVCRLSDLMEICVGIKTTADTVFVKPMTENFIEENSFEKNVIYPLIQSFDVKRWKITWGESKNDRYILYPHREKSGTMEAIPLEDIPNAAAYLESCSDVLKKRTYLMESKTRMWYECWVPQKLSTFRQAKIVTRDIVSHNSFAYDTEGRLCQGNTFFLVRKPDSLFNLGYSELKEEKFYLFILGLLNSKAMEYYQKMISGCLYSQKYRYTSTNLNRWPIPNFDKETAVYIADLVKQLIDGKANSDDIEKRINIIVNEQFGFSDSDIEQIEDFIKVAV